MARPKNTTLAEIRVQVSIAYDLSEDSSLFELVKDTENFKCKQNQLWGAYLLDSGFIIFEGAKTPTLPDIEAMIASVNVALKECRRKNKTHYKYGY